MVVDSSTAELESEVSSVPVSGDLELVAGVAEAVSLASEEAAVLPLVAAK